MVVARRHPGRSRGNRPISIGPYAVERQLLEAGTGPVYLGRDPAGRAVVIKVISAAFARDHEFRRRLRADLETVRALAPPTLAEIIDADTAAQPPYVVTEFVDAPSLAFKVAHAGPLPRAEVWALAHGLVSALTGLHGAGLVSADLKPANVLLSEGGIRLLDFGLSRVLNTVALPARAGAGPGMGTPAFITPEHVLRQPLTAASDIFTWGGVVLFAATGGLPFGNGTPQVLLQRAVYAEPDLVGLDDTLRDVVSMAMRKDPSRRPTAAELLEMLEGRLAPLPVDGGGATPGALGGDLATTTTRLPSPRPEATVGAEPGTEADSATTPATTPESADRLEPAGAVEPTAGGIGPERAEPEVGPERAESERVESVSVVAGADAASPAEAEAGRTVVLAAKPGRTGHPHGWSVGW